MRRAEPTVLSVAILLFLLAGSSSAARAATLTIYTTEGSFLEADGSLRRETFDEFDAGTRITTQIPGMAFSSPNDAFEGFSPIRVISTTGASSPPNVLGGGYVVESPEVCQIIDMDFPEPITALAFQLVGQDPSASDVSVHFIFSDESSQTLRIGDTDERESTPEFFGVTSDTPIVEVRLTSGRQDFGEGGFEEFGIDDLLLPGLGGDEDPPLCSSTTVDLEGAKGIDGMAREDRETDTGIESVMLAEGSLNLTLSVDPNFEAGASSVSFLITQTDSESEARGAAVVRDGAGNTCEVRADFRNLPEGPLEDQVLCSGGGILFQVSNANTTPAGTSACSGNLPSPEDPNFPPGYEPSPEDDPFPCTVLTIDSPVFGSTEMVYKKDGTFDPRLRLLFSRLEGAAFSPFMDITEEVQEIATITPDPTRIKGGGVWSTVKVACAIQSETCNGADDDGDGMTDEGLPVGDPSVDADKDGFALCPAAGAEGDCNDQIAAINPDADETCNGLDDDCDGAIDDGDPGGGASCVVAGQMGACAAGVTECSNGQLECRQVVGPTAEVCNGVDDDCDGTADEGFIFGGYLPPVNQDGSSIFRRTSTIPFKFTLTGCSGQIVSDAGATIQVFFFASGIVGSELETAGSSGSANTDDLYRFDASSGQYIYNLSAKTLTPNSSYLVRTHLSDGTHHDVIVSIR